MKFCHITMNVENMEKSLEFYRDSIGLPVNRRFQAGEDVEIAFLADGGTEIELIERKKNKEISVSKDISIGFEVGSLEETLTFLKEKQVPFLSDIIPLGPGVRCFFVADPDGVRIQIIEHKRS